MIKCTLKNLMEQRDVNFTQLSSAIGISRQALTALANNESKGIQFSTLDKLLSFFNISFDDFFIQSDMEFSAYADFEDYTGINDVDLCIQFNKSEVIIPYSIDYLSNQENDLAIIEFSINIDKKPSNVFKVSDPFFQLLLKISDDRFVEFCVSLIRELLPEIKDDYNIMPEFRINFDLEYDYRTAWVSVDKNCSPILYKRGEYKKADDFLYLPLLENQ
ncbi:helix-turn-helix domain-containing protein [Enterococcus casseliflavus]|uniref:Helix-turn-helix transcriptional regulator n=1 Tax=Enterococcus casseliflavus TaxID=37734 RepID=A0AAW8URW7_ENTCA|nr:helix-turn-helix transcriptional regulator [Enterococcus casseliflavus]MDT2965635.1 helix-turn-helix transcriptional regulator [Enterococcus casseliflavus]